MPIATQQSTETQGTWRIFGHIPGIAPGTTYKDRDDCADSLVHRPRRRGISGSQHDGAWSICLAGGYKENRDQGYTIIYSGEGRGKSSDKKQLSKGGFPQDDTQLGDQEWIRGNEALRTSYHTGKPVRVVRGAGPENYAGNSIYTPVAGYRYDGLYTVIDCRETKGEEGFMVCVFTLSRNPNQVAIPTTTYWQKTSHMVRKKKKIRQLVTEYPRTIKKRTAVQANAAFAEQPDPVQRALKRQRKAASTSSLPGGVHKRHLYKPSSSSSSQPSPAGTSSINPIVIDLTDDEQCIPPPSRSASSGTKPNPGPTGTRTTTQRRDTDSSFTKRDETPKQACQPLVDTTGSLALLDGVFHSLTMRDR